MLTWWMLPPRAPLLPSSGTPPIRGAVHVHSRRSDGSGTVEEIAAAAARAGLRFVVFTDHGDGTRPPDPPAWHSGVLCIDAVEVSTFGGHVVALGIQAAPYPLGGEAADVVEDIHRLGGVAIAAHPTSPKAALAWHDRDAPVDGIEWLNGDTEWRDESAMSLARVLLTYPWRGPESLALLLDPPAEALGRWNTLAARRQVFALAVPDAHARVGLPGESGDERSRFLAVPSYEQMFRSLSIALDAVVLTGDAPADAATVLAAVKSGRFYSTVDGLARGMTLEFRAIRGDETFAPGDRLPPGDGPVMLRAAWTAPAGAEAVLLRDGQVTQSARVSPLTWTATEGHGVYRAEIRWPGTPEPRYLAVSNPIYLGSPVVPVTAPPAPTPPVPAGRARGRAVPLADARLEQSPDAVAALDLDATAGSPRLTFRFGLGGTRADSPYAATAFALGSSGFDGARAVRLALRGDSAMRVSIQLRDAIGRRWRRSIYVGTQLSVLALPVSTFKAVDPGGAAEPSSITTVLIVADTTNTALGANGQLHVTELMLEP